MTNQTISLENYVELKNNMFKEQLESDIEQCNRVILSNEKDLRDLQEYSSKLISETEGNSITREKKDIVIRDIQYRLAKESIAKYGLINANKELVKIIERRLEVL